MLQVFYVCPKCGYQHPVFENWESFSPEKTLAVSHKDELRKKPCGEILHRRDDSFSLEEH
jgi:hypothetical protein